MKIAFDSILKTLSDSVTSLLCLGIVTFIMLLLGNLYIRKKATGVARVAANKATFNATLVLAIMVGLWALITVTDRLFAEGSAEAMTRMPF